MRSPRNERVENPQLARSEKTEAYKRAVAALNYNESNKPVDYNEQIGKIKRQLQTIEYNNQSQDEEFNISRVKGAEKINNLNIGKININNYPKSKSRNRLNDTRDSGWSRS